MLYNKTQKLNASLVSTIDKLILFKRPETICDIFVNEFDTT